MDTFKQACNEFNNDVENFTRKFLAKLSDMADTQTIGSVGVEVKIRGSLGSGMSVEFGVCLTSTYVNGADPHSNDMHDAFVEACRRADFDAHAKVRLITLAQSLEHEVDLHNQIIDKDEVPF